MSKKPLPTEVASADQFDAWYWDKPELVAICVHLKLPKTGGKDALRDRVLHFLKTGETLRPTRISKKGFNWSSAVLTRDTLITDTVSFGPNMRRFLTQEIGKSFVCHSDFMDWVREHPGKTLGDAIAIWHELEQRKADPGFRRQIAPHNNYLQYLRDYRDANPEHSQKDAIAAWQARKALPIDGERIVYKSEDAG